MKILIKKLLSDAKVPAFGREGDAGLDLFSAESLVLKPGERVSCKTGIAIKIPVGYVGLVWDKSGLSHNFGLKTLGGVFDSNYTGEYFIGLINLGQENFEIKKGQKIAQLLIQKVEAPKIKEVSQMPKTSRGAQGFGSSGIV
jgi:dUTP pyrophosphatase